MMSKPKNRKEYQQEIAEEFTHLLEEKGFDWKQGWHSVSSMPQNAVTEKHYNGLNWLKLLLIAKIRKYEDPRWATFVQITDKDNVYHKNEKWHLKQGSKGTWVEYCMPYDNIDKHIVTWSKRKEDLQNGNRSEDDYTLRTKYSLVFNATDIEGIAPLKDYEASDADLSDIVIKLSNNMNVPLAFDGNGQAYYSSKEDTIHLPEKQSFFNDYELNSTALHELAHATGNEKRLNRLLRNPFGSENYAFEELVAEMASCMLSADLEETISKEHMESHKGYIQSWINEIKEKPDTLTKAIKEAQRAANYMDYKAELISESEYNKYEGKITEIEKSRNEYVETKDDLEDIINSTDCILEDDISTVLSGEEKGFEKQ